MRVFLILLLVGAVLVSGADLHRAHRRKKPHKPAVINRIANEERELTETTTLSGEHDNVQSSITPKSEAEGVQTDTPKIPSGISTSSPTPEPLPESSTDQTSHNDSGTLAPMTDSPPPDSTSLDTTENPGPVSTTSTTTTTSPTTTTMPSTTTTTTSTTTSVIATTTTTTIPITTSTLVGTNPVRPRTTTMLPAASSHGNGTVFNWATYLKPEHVAAQDVSSDFVSVVGLNEFLRAFEDSQRENRNWRLNPRHK